MRTSLQTLAISLAFLSIFGTTSAAFADSASDEQIMSSLKTASLVVVGKISAIFDLTTLDNSISEHNPQWMGAKLDVEEVLSGDAKAKNVLTLFSGSQDRAWSQSPKLAVNQEGVFILHLNSQYQLQGIKVSVDLQSRTEVDRVKKLISELKN